MKPIRPSPRRIRKKKIAEISNANHRAWRVNSPAWPRRPAPSSWETAAETAIIMPTMNTMPADQIEEPMATAPRSSAPSRPAIRVSTSVIA